MGCKGSWVRIPLARYKKPRSPTAASVFCLSGKRIQPHKTPKGLWAWRAGGTPRPQAADTLDSRPPHGRSPLRGKLAAQVCPIPLTAVGGFVRRYPRNARAWGAGRIPLARRGIKKKHSHKKPCLTPYPALSPPQSARSPTAASVFCVPDKRNLPHHDPCSGGNTQNGPL